MKKEDSASGLRRWLSALLTALVCGGLATSCYHRSVITEPFRSEAAFITGQVSSADDAAVEALSKELAAATTEPARQSLTNRIHALVVRSSFPSAQQCGRCHERHYRQWSASPHAYAQLSPVFNAMQGKITQLTNGTNGDFCIRCHTPVGMSIGEQPFMANADRHATSREGVTCIVCHRVDREYGKVNGRFAIVRGEIFDPVYGPTGNEGLKQVLDDKESFALRGDSKSTKGQPIHGDIKPFFQLQKPGFCGMCHDVNGGDGFRLEELFSEYKSSPAAARGESCQDCHMGNEPGRASGYPTGPAAIVSGMATRERKLTNHVWAGPDVSVVHPGLFPHNPKALRAGPVGKLQGLASFAEWLQFDHEAGWGTAGFENQVARQPERFAFPERWARPGERVRARKILDEQERLLAEVTERRLALLRNGYKLSEIEELEVDGDTLAFSVVVSNGTDGHGAPAGFIAERLIYLRVTVRDGEDRVLFRSGDDDPNGDLRDRHSVYVHNGERSVDRFLFSLQSKFITRNLRGGEREQVLAVNHSLGPLPFLRPSGGRSNILTGRPAGARIHKQSLPIGGQRRAHYQADVAGAKGPLKIKVELISGMVPVNLIAAIQDVGFDYGLSARELARRVVAARDVLWTREIQVPR